MGDYLVHYGVKGMKWGRRKADNKGSIGGSNDTWWKDPRNTGTKQGSSKSDRQRRNYRDKPATGSGTGGVYKRESSRGKNQPASNRTAPGSDNPEYKNNGRFTSSNHITGVTGAPGYINPVTGKPVWLNNGTAGNIKRTQTKDGRYIDRLDVRARTANDREKFSRRESKEEHGANSARYGNFEKQKEARNEKKKGKFRFSKTTLEKANRWIAKFLGKSK